MKVMYPDTNGQLLFTRQLDLSRDVGGRGEALALPFSGSQGF